MYAIIRSGGKQYLVKEGDVIQVELIQGKAGDVLDIKDVLMIGGESPTVGPSPIPGAVVKAEVLGETKGDKIIGFKRKRRKNYRRSWGHRQAYTSLRIQKIVGGSRGA